MALMLAGGSQDLAVGLLLYHHPHFPRKRLPCPAQCIDVAPRADCARTEPHIMDVAPQFGMGPMPFIMFLLCMAGAGMCCCFMNRKRLLEWAASGGRGEYDEIYED